MFHPTRVTREQIASSMELGTAVAKLRYDQQPSFLRAWAKEAKRQARGDKERGRVQLATALDGAAAKAEELAVLYSDILALCRPHMKEEFDVIPEED